MSSAANARLGMARLLLPASGCRRCAAASYCGLLLRRYGHNNIGAGITSITRAPRRTCHGHRFMPAGLPITSRHL